MPDLQTITERLEKLESDLGELSTDVFQIINDIKTFFERLPTIEPSPPRHTYHVGQRFSCRGKYVLSHASRLLAGMEVALVCYEYNECLGNVGTRLSRPLAVKSLGAITEAEFSIISNGSPEKFTLVEEADNGNS